MVTTRRFRVCVVGAMCASAPPAEGFTPPGCLVRAWAAGDAFYASERRSAVAMSARSAPTIPAPPTTTPPPPPPPDSGENGTATTRVGRRMRGLIAPPAYALGAGERWKERKARQALLKSAAPPVDMGALAAPPRLGQISHASPSEIEQLDGVLNGQGVKYRQSSNPSLRMPRRPQEELQKDKRAAWEAKQKERLKGVSQYSALKGAQRTMSGSGQRAGRSSSDNPLRVYLTDMSRQKLLTADEEVVLGRHIQKGVLYDKIRSHLEAAHKRTISDEDWATSVGLSKPDLIRQLRRSHRAKMNMINSNLRLVVHVAKRYRFRGLTFQDLIQEGTFGLVKASERFDPERGFKFSTYATWWIKQAVLRGLADQDRLIRLPAHVHNFLSLVRRGVRELTDILGQAPTDVELSERLECSVEKLRYYRAAARQALSMDAPIDSKEDPDNSTENQMGSALATEDHDAPEEKAQGSAMQGGIYRLLGTLAPREQMVIRARFGLDGLEPKTLEDIGRAFHLTRERVRQIELTALHKLRQPYRHHRVQGFTTHYTGEEGFGVSAPAPSPSDIAAAAKAIAEAEAQARQSELNSARSEMGLESFDHEYDPTTIPPEGLDGDVESSAGRDELVGGRPPLPERGRGRMSHADREAAQRVLEAQWALEVDEDADDSRYLHNPAPSQRSSTASSPSGTPMDGGDTWSMEFLDFALSAGSAGGPSAIKAHERDELWPVSPEVEGKGSGRWASMSPAEQAAMEKAAETWSMAKESEKLREEMTPEQWARELSLV